MGVLREIVSGFYSFIKYQISNPIKSG